MQTKTANPVHFPAVSRARGRAVNDFTAAIRTGV